MNKYQSLERAAQDSDALKIKRLEREVERLKDSIREIRNCWACSDCGGGGVESIAGAIGKAVMLAEVITAQDIAETMVEDVR